MSDFLLDDQLPLAAQVLSECAGPVAPPPELKQRLLKRIKDYETLKPLADLRSHDGEWIGFGVPGIEVRELFRDRQTGRSTALLRMAAGARVPAHRHFDDEQCLVLSGDIGCCDLVYREGDFVVMAKDTDHPEIYSVNGNLLLLVSGKNEYAPG